MRAVFVGASSTSLATAHMLLRRGHEVVLVEQDRDRIEALAHEIDCGILHGDGSKPAVLREADPEHTDLLYCLTNNDQANILASLVGRTLGFHRVVCKIRDPQLSPVCTELGLEDVIIPAQAIGRYLAEMSEGQDPWEISAKVRGEARLFSFVVREGEETTVRELDLPGKTRVVCAYRGEEFLLPDDDSHLAAGDEVVLVTESKALEKLFERWGSPGRLKR